LRRQATMPGLESVSVPSRSKISAGSWLGTHLVSQTSGED